MNNSEKETKKWVLKNFLKVDEYNTFRQNVIDRFRKHEDKIQKLKEDCSKNVETDINIEMFGIKLIKARLINATKSLLISVIIIGICLYFISRWL